MSRRSPGHSPGTCGLEPDFDGADLEALRDAFVEAYNARDLEAVLELVSDEVRSVILSTRS
jgi:hypothetical protein